MTHLVHTGEAFNGETFDPCFILTPNSFALKKACAGRFENLNMTHSVREERRITSLLFDLSRNIRLVQAKNEGDKINLSKEDSTMLKNYLYQLLTVGYLGRKGKDKPIFGIPEAKTIVQNFVSEMDTSGNINYDIQIAILFSTVLCTGVRVSSLCRRSVEDRNSPYLDNYTFALKKFRHVTIFRSGRDERDYKISVVTKIPYFKGKGKFMIEAERAFERTTVSFVKPSYAYDSEIDVALYVIALTFRRGVTEYDNFNAWYNGKGRGDCCVSSRHGGENTLKRWIKSFRMREYYEKLVTSHLFHNFFE
ncbi:hypothetical protein EDC94DRAFT_677535 [Helicostylum pulchrum]|nr:hypothetical protein EDC94DRAFT_677535 [Helicostylum pulchrum]